MQTSLHLHRGHEVTEAECETDSIVSEAPLLCRGRAIAEGGREWELKDCIAISKVFESSLNDTDAASSKKVPKLLLLVTSFAQKGGDSKRFGVGITGWRTRCSELFPYSVYFQGALSSAVAGLPRTKGPSSFLNGELGGEPGDVDGIDTYGENGVLSALEKMKVV